MISPMTRAAILLVGLAGCGDAPSPASDASEAPGDTAVADATPDVTMDAQLLVARRQAAVEQTAATSADCTAIGDFYWEIGDATGTLGQGVIGTTYSRTKMLSIASASKIVFGAAIVQQTGGTLSDSQKSALRMLSGYHGLNPIKCAATASVSACLTAGSPGPNYTYSASEVGAFHYDGAHDQYFAATAAADGGLGIGGLSASQLTTLVTSRLGISPGFVYSSPLPSGGLSASPAQFASFLRAIVAGDLALRDHLGEAKVCTLPGPACPTAVSSPSPFAWHYSYNHWVEDDPAGDGAFSSAGAFGFYPWISADKTLYGMLARQSEAGGGFDSVTCGQKLRRAWITAQAQ